MKMHYLLECVLEIMKKGEKVIFRIFYVRKNEHCSNVQHEHLTGFYHHVNNHANYHLEHYKIIHVVLEYLINIYKFSTGLSHP